jgi:hypothetical protein
MAIHMATCHSAGPYSRASTRSCGATCGHGADCLNKPRAFGSTVRFYGALYGHGAKQLTKPRALSTIRAGSYGNLIGPRVQLGNRRVCFGIDPGFCGKVMWYAEGWG